MQHVAAPGDRVRPAGIRREIRGHHRQLRAGIDPGGHDGIAHRPLTRQVTNRRPHVVPLRQQRRDAPPTQKAGPTGHQSRFTRACHASTLVVRRSGGDPADVELGDQLGLVEHVDRHRAVADDRERQHSERPLAVERDHAGGAVDQRRTTYGANRWAVIAPRATRAAPLVEITALLTVVNIDRFNAAFGIGSAGFSEGMVCVPPDRPAANPALARIA